MQFLNCTAGLCRRKLITHSHIRTLLCSLLVVVLAMVVVAVTYLGHLTNCYVTQWLPSVIEATAILSLHCTRKQSCSTMTLRTHSTGMVSIWHNTHWRMYDRSHNTWLDSFWRTREHVKCCYVPLKYIIRWQGMEHDKNVNHPGNANLAE